VNSLTDQELLQDFVARRSEAAFAELARRHIDLVYSAVLRMVCDAHLAQDVTQGVFVALAQSARQLADRPVLSGWLHRTAQNIAANTVRSEVRRHTREQEAAAMNELLGNEPDTTWEMISPHLDAALGELDEVDRDAVMLRYFERKSAREMAAILGTSEEAAQKRVSRAVERLRALFSKRKLKVGTAGLVALISANAVKSAPAALAASIFGTTFATAPTIGITMIHKILITGMTAAVVATGLYAFHLQNELKPLVEQDASLNNQIAQLQQQLNAATNRLENLQEQNDQLQAGQTELLRLRAEVTRLLNRPNAPVNNSKLHTNQSPDRKLSILLKSKFVYVPADDVSAMGVEWTSSSQQGGRTGLLSSEQFKTIAEALQGASDVKALSAPRIVTGDGMEAEVSTTRAASVGGTNANVGEELDVMPYYSTNSSQFNLGLNAKLNLLTGSPAQPDFQTIQITNQIALSSGQTVVLETEIPAGAWVDDPTNISTDARSLLVFVTPSLPDAQYLSRLVPATPMK
jgi:RNA polymerase sigma factor (sigma-70 family)